jgi:hypothetical protein
MKIKNKLVKRFAEILNAEVDNPLIVQLTENVLAGQIICIDTVRHTIIGLPNEEQEA